MDIINYNYYQYRITKEIHYGHSLYLNITIVSLVYPQNESTDK